jgi:hypothetical protein
MSEVQSSHVAGHVPQPLTLHTSRLGGPQRGAADETKAVLLKPEEPDAARAVRDAPQRWPRVFPGL